MEALEELRNLVFRNADAVIDDARLRSAAFDVDVHLDVRSVGRVLQRVRQQVVDDLAHAIGISDDDDVVGLRVEANRARWILHAEGGATALEELRPANRLLMNLQTIRLDA